jgi:SOS-response transcriptional repressor LexA
MSNKAINPDKISNVLNYLIDRAGISEATLAREVDLPRNTINRLTAGKTPDPRISTLQAVAAYFRVTLDQLSGKSPIMGNIVNTFEEVKHLPVLTLAEASQWKKILTKIRPDIHHNWIIFDSSNGEGKFAVTVKGDAMWPQFQEGNIIIVDPHKMAENRNFVLSSIFKTGEIVLRQLFVDNGIKILKATNPIFPSITLTDKDNIIGVAIETRVNY